MPKKIQQILVFLFGVVFVVALLILAIVFPNPTPFQYNVFRVVLALAAAGVAALIPGFLQVSISDWLRAGGALAVFTVVYFFNPAALVIPTTEPNPTDPFEITLVCKVSGQIVVDRYDFPYADVKKMDNYEKFTGLVSQLPKQRCDQRESVIFRAKDEAIVDADSSVTATSGGNLGVIVIPVDGVVALGGNHLAFTKIYSYIRNTPEK